MASEGATGRRVDADRFNQIYRFKVILDNVEAAEVREVEGLTVQREVVEYWEGGENTFHHKLVGPTRYSNIVLKYGSSTSIDLYKWVQDALNGKIQRRDGTIMALNRAGETILSWDFKKAWPCRYQGPDFRAGESQMAIEVLELAHQGFELKKG